MIFLNIIKAGLGCIFRIAIWGIFMISQFFFPFSSLLRWKIVVQYTIIVFWEVRPVNCMKCGRELKDQQVFCDECLKDMERYPVKPGTPIQLPQRPAEPAARKRSGKRKNLKPEEQLPRLQSSIRWLTLALVVALIGFILSAGLVLLLLEERDNQVPIGQNYRTESAPFHTDCFT